MLLVFFAIAVLLNPSWGSDFLDAERIREQIDRKHKERFKRYFVDCHEMHLNFSDVECPGCQNRDFGLDLEEKLRRAGFYREYPICTTPGHCLGVTLLFIQYLLKHPPEKGDSCEKLLLDFQEQFSPLREMAHRLQIHQPGYYTNWIEKKWAPTDPVFAKRCFSLLIDQPVEEYVSIAKEERPGAKFHRVALFRALQRLAGRVILVGFSDEEGERAHCLAIYAAPEKILVFDANDGLFEFADFETLSYLHEQLLAEERLTFSVSFQMGMDAN